MKDIQHFGRTSYKTVVKLYDSVTLLEKTGLTNASSGLSITVRADNETAGTTYTGANIGTITTIGTWADPTAGKINIKEVSSANAPGHYEIHFENARLSVANSQKLYVIILCTGVKQQDFEIQLTSLDPYDAVRGGWTALPNAAAAAANGLPTIGTGANQISPDGTGAVPISFTTVAPTNPTAGTVGETFFLTSQRVGRRNTAQGGVAISITLDAGAPSTDHLFRQYLIKIVSGTGAGQFRTIIDYNGTTKVATVDPQWTTTPDNTSVFLLWPEPEANVLMVGGTVQTPYNLGAGVFLTTAEHTQVASDCQQAMTGFGYTGALSTNLAAQIGYPTAGVSMHEYLRRIGAAVAGVIVDAGASTEDFADWAGAACLSVTYDTNNNRTVVFH